MRSMVVGLGITLAVAAAMAVVAQERGHPGFSLNAANVTATKLIDISESAPGKSGCDDASDLGNVVLHSAGDTGSIYFCVQGKAPNYSTPRWFVVHGVQVQ